MTRVEQIQQPVYCHCVVSVCNCTEYIATVFMCVKAGLMYSYMPGLKLNGYSYTLGSTAT